MPLDILYSPTFLLSLFGGLALVVVVLCSALLGRQFTRPVVVVIGFALIGVGVLGHVSILDMEARGTEYVYEGILSAQVFLNFNRYREVFAYMFPAISAAIGTNAISDALLKHHTYEQRFSLFQFIKDVAIAFLLPIGFLACGVAATLWLICLPIGPVRRYLGVAVPNIWRWTQLRFLKLSIVTRYVLRTSSERGALQTQRSKAVQSD